MPSGRAALIERMQAMLGQARDAPIKGQSPAEAVIEDLRARHGDRFVHAEIRADRLLVVLDGDASLIASEQARLSAANPAGVPPVEDDRSPRLGDAATACADRHPALHEHPSPHSISRRQRLRCAIG
jgi:hypothetical protein